MWVPLTVIIYSTIFDKKSLKIDFYLLLTFFFFFGLTDNLIHFTKISISSSTKLFFYSLITSQFLSNVPSTLFFSDFTENWKALLWGVNAGGIGTLINSLANLITYKFYAKKYPQKEKSFLVKFHILNFLFLGGAILLFFVFRAA